MIYREVEIGSGDMTKRTRVLFGQALQCSHCSMVRKVVFIGEPVQGICAGCLISYAEALARFLP